MWSNAKTKTARKKRTGFEWATRSTNIEVPSHAGGPQRARESMYREPVRREPTLPSARPVAWPPRAFATDAATLAPEDVVEYVSDEYEIAQRAEMERANHPARRTSGSRLAEEGPTPLPLPQPLMATVMPVAEQPSSSLVRFVSEHWPLAAAFVLVGGLVWRLSVPIAGAQSLSPAASASLANVAKSATCSDSAPAPSTSAPMTTAAVSVTPASVTPASVTSTPNTVGEILPSAAVPAPPRAPRAPASVRRPPPKTSPSPSSIPPASEPTTKATAESRRALDLALTELASY